MKREVGIVIGLLAALVLVVLLFFSAVLAWLKPEPAPAEIARAEPPARVTRTAAARVDAPPPIPENEGYVVYGRVLDQDGAPVPDAVVSALPYETETDHSGRYELELPVTITHIGAAAFQYGQTFEGVLPESEDTGSRSVEPGDEIEVDLVLHYRRQVRVYCAGMPDDRCEGMLAHCTTPYLPVGESCHGTDGDLVCFCPEGEVAIRGAGRSVLIGPDDTEAWLDFRDTGRLVGAVRFDGEPVDDCRVGVIRVPTGLEDVPRGFVSARRKDCDPDGSFTFEGLVEGDWEVIVDRGQLQRTLTPQRVRTRRTTDVGDIDLDGGAAVAGVLIDGLTGEPLHNEPVLALRVADRGERVTPQGADTDHQGRFLLRGLPAGRWRIAHPLSPHEYTEVTVADGDVVEDVDVFTSDATSLDINGFTLSSVDGQLVVDEVVEGSPADLAGLQLDDRVLGVSVAGFDLAAWGEDGAAVSRLVLGHWDGPGISLTVQRDGEEVDVPLDW